MTLRLRTVTLALLAGYCFSFSAFAASQSALMKPKKEAEAKGYIFETSHDEIVAKAKKEGTIQVLSSLNPNVYPLMIKTFQKKYPFIQVKMHEITGPDSAQRFLGEVKAGVATEFDLVRVSSDFYPEYIPHVKKFDILGMAEHGVVGIPPKMVDPKNRTIVALGNGLLAVAYNKNLLPADKVPNKWEDFLKPEFKGRKFLIDIRPHMYAAFASCPEQGLGLEWMLNYAKRIREQEPIWFRGNTRALTGIIAGEYALHSGTHYHAAIRAKEQDRTGAFQVKLIEPIPMNLIAIESVLGLSSRPYAALLFLEHQASPEGQKLIDEHEPLKASIHSPESAIARETKGKKVCANGFDTFQASSEWMAAAVKAFGLPKAER